MIILGPVILVKVSFFLFHLGYMDQHGNSVFGLGTVLGRPADMVVLHTIIEVSYFNPISII